MSEPVIVARTSLRLTLAPGTYWWCACGRSATQPWCDGSHKGTSFAPTQLVIEKEREVFLCQCKRTGNAPFCDGTHNTLR